VVIEVVVEAVGEVVVVAVEVTDSAVWGRIYTMSISLY